MTSILELQDVTKSFGDYVAVDKFNFQVKEGELRCLLGPNGAGKTTAMDLITGRQRITSGRVLFEGNDITRMREHDIVRSGIGRKFQVPAVFKELSVEQNLQVAANSSPNPFANMFRFGRAEENERLERIIELIGLQDRLDAVAANLSHGETQWLEIGMVLTLNPKLLLMDEPTAGMTEQETHKTSQIFNRLRGDHTLVVVEHDMAFVREIATVVTVMHMGHVLVEGPMAEVEQDPTVQEVYLGPQGMRNVA